jgi:hypothetical protein
MRVLLTNNTLGPRAGTELYVYDVALELLKRGHQPIAFSPHLGEVAELLRAATVPVVQDLSLLSAPPDVIHGHHHYECLIAVLSFPETPAINFCHGWAPSEEEPLMHPSVLRYVAVDHVCRDRLEFEHGIDASRIRVILNSVDTARFRSRTPLPSKPTRALAFGNTFDDHSTSALRSACEKDGIAFAIAGVAAGRPEPKPEALLAGYDVVFAKARAALEAMAVGAAVVLCGPRGLGPMVTSAEWDRLRALNFGVRALSLPMDADAVLAELSRYDAHDAAAVSDRVRVSATLDAAVDALLHLYREVIEEASHVSFDPCGSQRAVARYLGRHASIFKGCAIATAQSGIFRADAEQLRAQLGATDARRASVEAELQRCGESLRQAERRRATLDAQLAQSCEEVRAIRESATWRIARSILDSPLGPLLDQIGRYVRGKR